MEFSLRYPPVRGRLHTRYAPVRRSPPGYCYPALPLDLHVLSLPLAFILSQDQTLHCKNCSFYLLELPFNAFLRPGNVSLPTSLSPLRNALDSSRVCTLFFIVCQTHAISSFSSLSTYSRLQLGKRVQKYNLFPNNQNIFSKIFTPTPHNL